MFGLEKRLFSPTDATSHWKTSSGPICPWNDAQQIWQDAPYYMNHWSETDSVFPHSETQPLLMYLRYTLHLRELLHSWGQMKGRPLSLTLTTRGQLLKNQWLTLPELLASYYSVTTMLSDTYKWFPALLRPYYTESCYPVADCSSSLSEFPGLKAATQGPLLLSVLSDIPPLPLCTDHHHSHPHFQLCGAILGDHSSELRQDGVVWLLCGILLFASLSAFFPPGEAFRQLPLHFWPALYIILWIWSLTQASYFTEA